MTEQSLLLRFLEYQDKLREPIRCKDTGKPLIDNEQLVKCVCCTGFHCAHKFGATQRLYNALKRSPNDFPVEVFNYNPIFQRLRRFRDGR